MRKLKRFKNQTAYTQYLSGDDIWLPRVSLILNKGADHTNNNKYSDNGPSRVEYSRLGTEFIQVANGGCMYFFDKIYTDASTGHDISYTAAVDGDAIVIRTTDLETNQLTNHAYIDDENSQIVVNYPTGAVSTFSI